MSRNPARFLISYEALEVFIFWLLRAGDGNNKKLNIGDLDEGTGKN